MHTLDKKSADQPKKHHAEHEPTPAEDTEVSSYLAELPASQQPSAILRLQQTHGNAYVLRQLQTMRMKPTAPAITPASAGRIQRYQAGEAGHGGIEARAFKNIGFSDQEASAIYFGNWLRDFSQLNTSAGMYQVVRILGWGEFNREVSRDELGSYVPSEHLDNPSAGGLSVPDASADTVEDPAIQALSKLPKGDPRRKRFDDAFERTLACAEGRI